MSLVVSTNSTITPLTAAATYTGSAFNVLNYDNIYGGLIFTEKSDLVIRITSTSISNVAMNGGYDLIVIKN